MRTPLKRVQKPVKTAGQDALRSFQHLQRHKRQLHDEEFYQLLRQQQELLEDQKKQLEEHQRILSEKVPKPLRSSIKGSFWMKR